MVYWANVSQYTEQKELSLSELVTNWTLEEYILKIDELYCITVTDGVSNGAVPDTKIH